MKKFLLSLAMLGLAAPVLAFNEKDAIKLVKKYSETVACQLEMPDYRAVKVFGDPGKSERGDQYVVAWTGDVGCYGGNGTAFPVFTLVEVGSFDTPVVHPELAQPELELAAIKKISFSAGLLQVLGVNWDNKPVSYRLKVNEGGFVKQ